MQCRLTLNAATWHNRQTRGAGDRSPAGTGPNYSALDRPAGETLGHAQAPHRSRWPGLLHGFEVAGAASDSCCCAGSARGGVRWRPSSAAAGDRNEADTLIINHCSKRGGRRERRPGRRDPLADRHPPSLPAAFRKLDTAAVLTARLLRAPRSRIWVANVWNRERAGSRAEPTHTRAVMTAESGAVCDQQTHRAQPGAPGGCRVWGAADRWPLPARKLVDDHPHVAQTRQDSAGRHPVDACGPKSPDFHRVVWGLTSRPPVPGGLSSGFPFARRGLSLPPPSSGFPSSGVLRFVPFGRCPVPVPVRFPSRVPFP